MSTHFNEGLLGQETDEVWNQTYRQSALSSVTFQYRASHYGMTSTLGVSDYFSKTRGKNEIVGMPSLRYASAPGCGSAQLPHMSRLSTAVMNVSRTWLVREQKDTYHSI